MTKKLFNLCVAMLILTIGFVSVSNSAITCVDQIAGVGNVITVGCPTATATDKGTIYAGSIGDNAPSGIAQVSAEERYVYLGGQPLGIEISENGLEITGFQEIITEQGRVLPAKNAGLKQGDILVAADGRELQSVSDIVSISIDSKGKSIGLKVKRDREIFDTEITPVRDILTQTYKLGLYLSAGVQGIGTLTYVDRETAAYRALGHSILRSGGTTEVKGHIYPATIFGVKKGERGAAGELKGTFSTGSPIGDVELNSSFGISGQIERSVLSGFQPIKIGDRNTAHIGRAYIYTTIDENVSERYAIEIVKVNRQTTPQEKGLVVKVTDERLLATTGGIVQGMSGSPIVQDGRLIGAISHVFVNDPTRGYGVYIDFME